MIELLMPVRLSDLAVDELSSRYDLIRLWEEPDPDARIAEIAPRLRALVVGAGILSTGAPLRVDADFIARFPKLELIANLGVGYDTIDAAFAAQRGIVVTNTPDVLTDETADTAFGLLLNTVRRFPAAERYLRAGRWLEAPFPLTRSLKGRTLGVLGLGRIGKAIARRAEAFGLQIAYTGRRRQADVPYAYYASARELAAASDILMVSAPASDATRCIVDADVLQALGPEGYLINIARGSLVDEDALIAALQTGVIAGAGLDVFAHEPRVPPELIEMETVVLLPHVGSATQETRRAMALLLVENVDAWAAGRRPPTPVPECDLAAGNGR